MAMPTFASSLPKHKGRRRWRCFMGACMLLWASGLVARSQALSCQILSPADGTVITSGPLSADFIRGTVATEGGAPQVTVQLQRVPGFGGKTSEALWNGDVWVETFLPSPADAARMILPVSLTNAGGAAGTADWTYTGLLPQPGSQIGLSLLNGYYRVLATARDPSGREKTTVTTF